MIDRTSAVSLLAIVGLTSLLGGCSFQSTGETRTETVSFDLGDAKAARVELRMGSGELNVSGRTPKLAEGKFSYSVAEWKPVVEYRADESAMGQLKLSQPTSSGSSFGNAVNNWDIKLNGELPLDVIASLGAGEANLDLSEMNLSRVEMSIGAGKVDVDLRGQPTRSYDVQIHGGVGETVVHLPKDVGISARATKGLGHIDIQGLEQRDGVWVNPDRIGAPVTVRIDVKGGVGEIRLVR